MSTHSMARAALEAENGKRLFAGDSEKYRVILLDRLTPLNVEQIARQLEEADLVVHFAGINRAEPEIVENSNREIAEILVAALKKANSSAHLVYSNSSHRNTDTPYGRGKESANLIFQDWSNAVRACYTNLVRLQGY